MLGPFPNELWIIILSDVLGTYIHSLVFLPSDYECWHAHYILRSISKQFKALVDDIWGSAVGSSDTSSRTLRTLHASLHTGECPTIPSGSCSPLIVAYATYVMALIEQVHPGKGFRQISRGRWFNIRSERLSERLFVAVLHLATTITPPEAGSTLRHATSAAFGFIINDTVTWIVVFMSSIIHHPSGPGMAVLTLNQALPLLADWKRKTLLEYKYVMDMEEILRSCPSPTELPEGEDEELRYCAQNLRQLSASVASFSDSWFEEYEAQQSRKRALYRAASCGVRGLAQTGQAVNKKRGYFKAGRWVLASSL